MPVVEKDSVVSGMLADELGRCEESLAGIQKALSALPKGALSQRVKVHKGKEYHYHYLKFREGGRVFNQHVAKGALKDLEGKLDLRRKYEEEAKAYRKRISYLKRLLKTKGRPRGTPNDK
jgi:hypothetical protein